MFFFLKTEFTRGFFISYQASSKYFDASQAKLCLQLETRKMRECMCVYNSHTKHFS